jgi:hypothetical protein
MASASVAGKERLFSTVGGPAHPVITIADRTANRVDRNLTYMAIQVTRVTSGIGLLHLSPLAVDRQYVADARHSACYILKRCDVKKSTSLAWTRATGLRMQLHPVQIKPQPLWDLPLL